MEKISKFMKLILVICITLSNIIPTISVFADTITGIEMELEKDINNDNYKIKAIDVDSINLEESYSINLVADFVYLNGEVVHSEPYTILNVLGSDLIKGYEISNFSSIMSSLGYNNYTNGYEYQEGTNNKQTYNGTYKFTIDVKDSKDEIISTVNDEYSSLEKNNTFGYDKLITSLGGEIGLDTTNNVFYVDSSVSSVSLIGYANLVNGSPNTSYTVSVNGNILGSYDSYSIYNGISILDIDLSDKLDGTYTYSGNVTFTDNNNISETYPYSFNIKYGNIDSYLTNSEYLFKNGLFVTEGSYDSSALTRSEVVNYITNTLDNPNYNVSIFDSNENYVNDSSTLVTDDIIRISGDGYFEEYKAIVRYDYDDDGLITYSDLNNIINEYLGNSEVSYRSNLYDSSLNPDSYDLRNIQKNIDKPLSYDEPTYTISPSGSDNEVYNGQEVRVVFNLEGSNDIISSFEGTFNYDEDYLTLKDVIYGDNLTGGYNKDTNKFYYAGSGIDNFITLVFTTKKSVDNTVVSINDLSVYKYDYEYNLSSNVAQANVKINKSNNAYLEYLTIAEADINFDKNTFEYNITIPSNVDKLTLDYANSDVNATCEFDNDSNGNFLVGQTKTLYIRVLAEDGVTEKIYKINVTKKLSSDNTLNSINISGNNITFTPDNNSYNISVGSDVNSLDLSVILNDSKATYLVYGNSNFKEGVNVVTIRVTAEDGTTKDYYINVTKASSNASGVTMVNNTNSNEEVLTDTSDNSDNKYREVVDTDTNKVTKNNDSDKTKKEGSSHVIIIILIILVIVGLIYLIFKDDEETKDANKKVNKLKK